MARPENIHTGIFLQIKQVVFMALRKCACVCLCRVSEIERERQRQKETERHRKGYIYNNRKGKKALNLKVTKEGCGEKGEGEDDVIIL